MVIDTSATVAVLFDEPEAARFRVLIAADPVLLVSVATVLEATLVVEGRTREAGRNLLARFLDEAPLEMVPVTVTQVEIARDAWRRFGKGNHAAALNFGDCFAYALARAAGEPLLCKGDDFPRTDLRLAT